jgi:chromosome segregation ATPase
MDQEQKFFEQMTGARQYIREVMQRFTDITNRLPALVKEHEELSGGIADLLARRGSEIAESKRRLEAELTTTRDGYKEELQSLSAELSSSRTALKDVQRQLATKQKDARRISGELDAQIAEKRKTLGEVTETFEAFKKQHGL